MKTLMVNALLVLLYVLGGLGIEVYGIESNAAFAFYGFCMGVFSLAINIGLESKIKSKT